MIHTGRFESTQGDRYRVVFDNGGAGSDLELSDNPAVIEYSAETDIYRPLKLSGATITILSEFPIYDLYSERSQGIKTYIVRESDNRAVWQGYVTPCLYTQDYAHVLTEIEIECIDCLSSLDDIKYNPTEKGVRSFKDLIAESIAKSGMAVSRIIVDSGAFDLNVTVSDLNWFDEDDEPATYKEILEEILKYAHVTMFQFESDIYIINYDRLIQNTSYQVYNSRWEPAGAISPGSIIIDQIYDGASISLSEIKNNFTVVGSPYNADEVIEDPLKANYLGKRMFDGERTYVADYTGFSSGAKKQQWTHTVVHFDPLNPNTILHQYNFDGSAYTGVHTPAQQQNYFCTWLLKSWGYDSGAVKDVGYPDKDDFNYYIGLRVADLNNAKSRALGLKVITIASNLGNGAVFPQGGYLCLSADCMFVRTNQTAQKYMYFPEYYNRVSMEVEVSELPYFMASFRIGDQYYNGNTWSSTPTTVKVQIGKKGSYKNFTWHSVKNTNDYRNGVDDLSGYLIKLPDHVLSGQLETVIYTPQNDHWNVDHVFIRNVKLDIAYKKEETEAHTEEEIKYDNKYNDTANDGSKDGEDIELKITTWDGSSYSKAAPVLSGKMLDLISGQKQEYNIIDSYLKQYKSPNKIIDLELDGLIPIYKYITDTSAKLVISGATYDLRNDTTTLNITQKR